ncbi:MAG: hypothetical protein P8P74_02490 [Crocinitomicaceae bacterium]|nr:hypothetical protein [Crocinitomicaceae bacterium]
MKNRGAKITITIVSMILFGSAAFFFHDSFYEFVISQLKDLNVSMSSTALFAQFSARWTFASVISLLPALFLFSHWILKDQKPKVFLLIIPITVLFGLALMAFHIYSIRQEMIELNEMFPSFIRNSLSTSNIHAARYLGIGFIVGNIFSTAVVSFTTRDRMS